MEARQSDAGGAGVRNAAERAPGEGALVEVDAVGDGMDLVGPVAARRGRFAVFIGQDRLYQTGEWAGEAIGEMGDEPVLLEQPVAIAHRASMALHEDIAARRGDDAGCREGAGARGKQAFGATGLGKAAQNSVHLR
jgi:hypothetical protein